MTLFVVDDEPIICTGIGTLVEKMYPKAEVLTFTSALTLLEKMEKVRPDIVISDIKMPEMDGLELLKEINARWADVSVIFLTSYPQFEYAQQAIRFGAVDYLLKPVRYSELMSAIDKANKHEVKHVEVEDSSSNTGISAIMQKAKKYIGEHYSEPLTLKAMGKVTSLSPSYFSEQFVRVNNQSFIDYLTDCRMTAAKRLLISHPEMSVTEVAMNVGYDDPGYFSTVFRKANGLSPKEYRQSLSKQV